MSRHLTVIRHQSPLTRVRNCTITFIRDISKKKNAKKKKKCNTIMPSQFSTATRYTSPAQVTIWGNCKSRGSTSRVTVADIAR